MRVTAAPKRLMAQPIESAFLERRRVARRARAVRTPQTRPDQARGIRGKRFPCTSPEFAALWRRFVN
jgi:hypothetical protein